jgi:hypothetical protein
MLDCELRQPVPAFDFGKNVFAREVSGKKFILLETISCLTAYG